MKSPQIIFIVGPTAVGKSRLAYELACQIGGEIVSCDSMQVYKELNIISDKPAAEWRDKVKHHMIDVVSITQPYDVSQYYRSAIECVENILKSSHVPIVVGGSGLYVQVLLDGIFDEIKADDVFRASLTGLAESHGNQHLYDQLVDKDKQAAEKIHVNDLKRIIRALEVIEKSGRKFSELKQERSGLWDRYDVRVIGLDMERSVLYERINQRVDQMFEMGVVDEIRHISQLEISATAKKLIGVSEILDMFEKGVDLETTKSLIKQNTRNFAKRQLTWFRKEQRIEWVKANVAFSQEDFLKGLLCL